MSENAKRILIISAILVVFLLIAFRLGGNTGDGGDATCIANANSC